MTTPAPPSETTPSPDPSAAASESVTTSAPATAPAPEPERAPPKYGKGDLLKVPCHGGIYVAEVVHIYQDYADAEERYPKSFRTILQHRFKKPKHEQFYYYCEVNNTTRKPVGVAEADAELKWRKPSPPAGAADSGD